MKHISFGPGTISIDNQQLECALTSQHTPIFTYDSCQKSLDYDGKTKTWLYDFALHLSRFVALSLDILDDLKEPATIEIRNKQRPILDAEVFLEICRVILEANAGGYLYASELKYARRAKAILEYFEKFPLMRTVEMASGLIAFKLAVKNSVAGHFKADGKHFGTWVLAFPEEFFDGILKMKNWKWSEIRPHLRELASICSQYVFARLSEDQLQELSSQKPRMHYKKAGKPEQYILNEMMEPLFGSLLSIMEASNFKWESFELLANKQIPQISAQITDSDNDRALPQAKLAFFQENLTKAVSAGKFR